MKRVFNGKSFQAWNNGLGYPKKTAEGIVKGLRKTGFLARLTKEKNGWVIWYRRR